MTWFERLTGIDEESPEQVRAQLSVAGDCIVCPNVTPERGVGIYEHDRTQGPACAIACGAGTIYRNYFADVDGQIGQTSHRQIDCSADLERVLGNTDQRLWRMQNGYIFPSDDGLAKITQTIQSADEPQRDTMLGHLRIGLQLDAEVTLDGAGHRVSQAYCSALPVAYGRQPTDQWTNFAKLILDAIERAFQKFIDHGLDIRIVSYGQSKPTVAELVSRLGGTRSTTTPS